MLDRRTFIGNVAGGLLAVPFAAGAQKPAMPVIGFLSSASPAQWTPYVAGFRHGLNETGYVEGKNVAIEYRWAEGHYDRLPSLVANLVADNGVMGAKTLVVDTEAEKILGQGSIDFAKERYDLKLNAQSKRPSLIALRGPIVIDGSFKNPNVHPAVGPIVARVGTSLALGALNPLAALLALIDFGGASDANCRALIAEASGNVQATATAKKAATK